MGFDEIDLPAGVTLAAAAQAIEDAVTALELRVTSRGTLAQYPGSIHWHIKRGKDAGTLEVTLRNRERRLDFAVRQNRQGVWTSASLEAMTERLRTQFGVARPEA
jgi:hypothetical protein